MAVSPPPVSISLSHSLAPSSPGAGPSAPPSSSSSNDHSHTQNKTFRRLRTSLEHTIRAAAGSRPRKISQTELSASSSQSPASRTLDKKLRHKHSASDTALGPPPSATPMTPPKDKGKQRASVDFVGVERTRERERERERVQEKERERDRGGTGERTATARFGGGLRKLESKVGLRRLSSREANRADAPSPIPPPPPPSHQMTNSISGPAKLRKDRDRTIRDKEKEKDRPEPSMRTRSKSAWSFLAPSLTSHPSMSASALDVSTSTSSTEPVQRARTRENEREKETVRAAAPPRPRSPPQHPTPPSPTRPPRTSTSRSRGALTSPSSPALSSPTSSTSPSSLTTVSTPTTTPSPGAPPSMSAMPSPALTPRVRPRPDPIKPSAPSASTSTNMSTSTSASSSSSPHTLTRSNTTPVPPRSVPASPTAPSSGSTSQMQTPRNASPVPSRVSRPPLSPSAGANAGSRIRIRTSAANGAPGSGIRSVSTTSLPMEPSSLSSSATLSDKSERSDRGEKPERPERRRPSVGSATTVTANGTGTGMGTGRTTPTGGMPSHAAPTSSSRARAGSTRERSLDREREKERERQMTRSRASASASSLALSRGEVARSRSPSQSGGVRRPTSPTPLRGPSPAPLVPPGQRDTIRHAASLLLRELNGPRPRAMSRSPSAPSSQPSSPLQALFPSSTSTPGLALVQETWTPEVWDECEARLRLLARAERVRVGGPYGGSATSLTNAGASASVSSAGEERERKVFAEAIRDGYVLCQLVNKLRPGTIPRIDPYEDGFKTSANATKFLAAAAGAFSLPASELFQRDDLIRGTPDALFRVAKAVVAVVARAGEDAVADRVARKILLGGGGIAKEQGSGKGQGASNSPYGTRAKAASLSTPNLSTLQRSASPPVLGGGVVGPSPKKKRWSPPSPALSTVPAEDTGSGTVSPERAGSSKAGSAPGTKGRASEKAGSGSSSGNTHVQGVRPKARSPLKATFEDESALLTDTDTAENEGEDEDDEDDEDADEAFFDSREIQKPRTSSVTAPKPPPKPVPGPVRASVASEATQTTQSTAPSSLLAAGRPSESTGGGGERASQQFGTMRTATTMATSVLSDQYRGDVSAPASEASVSVSHWDEPSAGSAPSSSFVVPPLLKKPPIRDRRPSEAAMNDLTRVAEEAEDGTLHVSRNVSGDSSGGHADGKRRPQAIQLGKGKWPEDFVQAFSPGSPPRPIALHRGDTERGLSSSPQAASPPRLQLLANANGNDSAESLPQLAPRRPTHRPRHSLDAPVLRPKELNFGRESSPAPEGTAVPRIIPRRSNSANRHGVYIPRSDSASPTPSPEPTANTRVPFPRAVSGEQAVLATTTASGAEVSATTAAASAAQQSRFSRGRFQSEVDAGTRRRPRPNSYDELGAKPHRSRIESMTSLGGVSSSNFSASDIRSSMDGSAMRKTLIIRDEGKPSTHFQLGNCIGRGQFGSVYRALNLNTGQMVAVKRIRLEGLSEDDVKQLMREVDVVKSLSHPSIVKYEGMSRDSDTLNIVLEYAENGSLGQTLKAFGKLNEKLVATYVIKILEGLDYLHRNDVVHCDLKAANILTTKTGNVKLSDFGVSLNLRKVGNTHKSDVTGTPNWMAPEVIELKGASRASDIWSLGCTVIELLTGRPPYAEILNSMSVMYRIVDDAMPPIPDDWSPLLKDFLQQCFQREPADRPNAEVLGEHEWLREHCEVHKVLRPKESIPFLRRVSQDLQQRPDVVRFLGVTDVPRSDSRASSDLPRRSEDGSASPATSGLPGSPPKKRLSAGPTTPKSPESEVPVAREHSFVKTAFGKPLLCRVCMQSVKKHAVVCEDCSLIAHSHCAPNAPQSCGFRAQLLQYANYSPAPESPNALEILRQFTPSGSPAAESVLAAHHPHTSTPEIPPPTAFKMFNAFRRSRSSLTADQDRSRKRAISMSQTSGEGSSESVLASQPVGQPIPRPSRSGVLLKPPRARPISTSSENTTQNRGSQRSAETAGSIDLSDDSYSQAHSHSHSPSQSTMYTYSRSQSALPSPSQVLGRSRSRGRNGTSGVSSPLGAGSDGETETEADGVRYSRFSVAASAADSADPRRASVLAGSSVGGSYDDHEENDELERRAWRRKPRRLDARQSAGGEKEKGCVLQ